MEEWKRTFSGSTSLGHAAVFALFIAALTTGPWALADVTTRDMRAKAVDVVEHTIDFMVTLGLASLAVVGYFAKDGMSKKVGWRCGQLFIVFLFGVASIASLLFAYWGRLDIAGQLSAGGFALASFSYYVKQAWTLVFSAVFAFIFVLSTFRK